MGHSASRIHPSSSARFQIKTLVHAYVDAPAGHTDSPITRIDGIAEMSRKRRGSYCVVMDQTISRFKTNEMLKAIDDMEYEEEDTKEEPAVKRFSRQKSRHST